MCATYVLGSAFVHVSDKNQAWQDLNRLTNIQDRDVRMFEVDALGTAFAHILRAMLSTLAGKQYQYTIIT